MIEHNVNPPENTEDENISLGQELLRSYLLVASAGILIMLVVLIASLIQMQSINHIAEDKELIEKFSDSNKYSLQKATSISKAMPYISIGLLLVLIVTTIVLSRKGSKQILIPISALVQASQDLASGKIETKIYKASNDELGQLVDSFNEMRKTIVIEQQRLKKSNEDLEQFAYVASHDLKSPLRGIDNLAKWIQKDLGENLQGQAKEDMVSLRGRINRLESLLDDLLAYSRAGKEAGEGTEVNVRLLIEDLTDLLKHSDTKLNVETKGLPIINTQKTALELIFRNLLSNSIKHHDHSEVNLKITSVDRGDHYEFSVQDDGPGISEKFQDKIFEMFQTLKSRDEVEGSGMGLAIIKKIIVSQGGEISVISKDKTRGTRFVFTWMKTC